MAKYDLPDDEDAEQPQEEEASPPEMGGEDEEGSGGSMEGGGGGRGRPSLSVPTYGRPYGGGIMPAGYGGQQQPQQVQGMQQGPQQPPSPLAMLYQLARGGNRMAQKEFIGALAHQHQMQVHAQLQQQAMEGQLSQGEKMRMQRMQSALSALDADPQIEESTKQQFRTAIKAGLDPLKFRAAQGEAALNQLKRQQLIDSHAHALTMQKQAADLAGKSAQERTVWQTAPDGSVHGIYTDLQGKSYPLKGHPPKADREEKPKEFDAVHEWNQAQAEAKANAQSSPSDPDAHKKEVAMLAQRSYDARKERFYGDKEKNSRGEIGPPLEQPSQGGSWSPPNDEWRQPAGLSSSAHQQADELAARSTPEKAQAIAVIKSAMQKHGSIAHIKDPAERVKVEEALRVYRGQ